MCCDLASGVHGGAFEKRRKLTMDNPNANFDDDSLSEEDAGETIKLRPFLDWRVRRVMLFF